MPGSTTRLGLYKPGGGSGGLYGPDEVADIDRINDDLDVLDESVGALNVTSTTRPASPFDGHIIKESDTGRAMIWRTSVAEWVELVPGTVPHGNTALRNLIWPTPANAAARVILANSIPRFFNTDKGWEEQYFAQFDDAGANLKFSAVTHGWKAIGRSLVHPTVITPTGGTAVDRGTWIHTGSGVSGVLLQGVFTSDFSDYEVVIRATATPGDATLLMRFAVGAVIESGAGAYGRNSITSDSPSTLTGSYNAGTSGIIGAAGTAGGSTRTSIFRPNEVGRTAWISDSHNNTTGQQVRATGHTGTSTAYDGLWIGMSNFSVGEIQVYGIGR